MGYGAHRVLTRLVPLVQVTPVHRQAEVPFTQPETLAAEANAGQLLKLLLMASRAVSVRTRMPAHFGTLGGGAAAAPHMGCASCKWRELGAAPFGIAGLH